MIDYFTFFGENFAGFRINHFFRYYPAVNTFVESLFRHIIGTANPDTFFRSAIFFVDNYVLRDIDQTTGQITSVSGPEGGIRQPFPSSVGGNEVLQCIQTFTEIGFNRQPNNTTGRISHQPAHSR